MSGLLILSGILLWLFNDTTSNELPFGAVMTMAAGAVMYLDYPLPKGGEEE
jgi:hypothetical protein